MFLGILYKNEPFSTSLKIDVHRNIRLTQDLGSNPCHLVMFLTDGGAATDLTS